MTTGTVKFFNESKGYGFIAPDGRGGGRGNARPCARALPPVRSGVERARRQGRAERADARRGKEAQGGTDGRRAAHRPRARRRRTSVRLSLGKLIRRTHRANTP